MERYIWADWAWLATDAAGRVAIFTTAGVAEPVLAIPRSAVLQDGLQHALRPWPQLVHDPLVRSLISTAQGNG